eukprot:81927_1
MFKWSNRVYLYLIIGLFTMWYHIGNYIMLNHDQHTTIGITMTGRQNNEHMDKIVNLYGDTQSANKSLLVISNGLMRSGSTILFNILRILIREKIDPNLYAQWHISNEYLNTKLTLLSKEHYPCDWVLKKRNEFGDWQQNWNLRIFISHRNVSEMLCSAMLTKSVIPHVNTQSVRHFCEQEANSYLTCAGNYTNYIAYDMDYYRLKRNMTQIIEEIAMSLNIDQVMTKYDYAKIENELDHLVTIKRPNYTKGIKNPMTEIHAKHIHSAQDQSKCDHQLIRDVIESSEICKLII